MPPFLAKLKKSCPLSLLGLAIFLLLLWACLNITPPLLAYAPTSFIRLSGGAFNFLLAFASLVLALKIFWQGRKKLSKMFLFLIGSLFFIVCGKGIGFFYSMLYVGLHSPLPLLSDQEWTAQNFINYLQIKGEILSIFMNGSKTSWVEFVHALMAVLRWLCYSIFLFSLLYVFVKKSQGVGKKLLIIPLFCMLIVTSLGFSNEFYLNYSALQTYSWPVRVLAISLGGAQNIFLMCSFLVFMLYKNKTQGLLFLAFILLISGQFFSEITPYIYAMNHNVQEFRHWNGISLAFDSLALTLQFIALLFLYHQKNDDLNSWLVEPHTLQFRLSVLVFGLCALSIFLFIVIIELTTTGYTPLHPRLLFPFLSLYLILVIVPSRFLSRILIQPIQTVEQNMALILKDSKTPTRPKPLFITEYDFLQNTIYDRIVEHKAETQQLKTMGELAIQVAHDIRSPLMSLQTFVRQESSQFAEKDRVFLRNAFRRLNDITLSMVSKYKGKEEVIQDGFVLVSVCILEILAEKRIECEARSIEFKFEVPSPQDYFALTYTNQTELKRMLSNLLNNAINASPAFNAKIDLILENTIVGSSILIKDYGAGMSLERVNALLEDIPVKEANIGFGLQHAKEYLKTIQGKLEIESELGVGTDVYISLPPCKAPDWLIAQCNVQDEVVCIIDDDQTIHEVWQEKLAAVQGLKALHFLSPEDFLIALEQKIVAEKMIILCDDEFLNSKWTGLLFLQQLQNQCLKILVTSYVDEFETVAACTQYHFKLLSKYLVPYFRFELEKTIMHPEKIKFIYIDNDLHSLKDGEFFADRAGVKIATYLTVEAFTQDLAKFERETPIYIDYDLGEDKQNGIDAAKMLFAAGFHEIYLTTGSPNIDISDSPWIKARLEKGTYFF